MPKVVTEKIGPLTEKVTLIIERADYESAFLNEINKVKATANFRGFRKGKVSASFIKRMYGGGVLAKLVDEIFNREVSRIFDTGYIVGPIPMEGQLLLPPDPVKLEDIAYSFEAARVPDFELKGVSASDEYEIFKVSVPAGKIAERMEDLRKRRGTYEEREDGISEEDLITIEAAELDENMQVMENGWKTTFSTLVGRVQEDVRSELLAKKVGDVFQFNIFQLELNASPEMVKKYLLNYSEDDIEDDVTTGEMFQGRIQVVKHMVPAKATPDFFTEVFGEGVDTEEKAMERLKGYAEFEYHQVIDALFWDSFLSRLLELNQDAIPLPEDFLKRWLSFAEPKSADATIANFGGYAERLRMNLLLNELIKVFDIHVTNEEVYAKAYDKAVGMLGHQSEKQSLVKQVVDFFIQDSKRRQEIVEEIMVDSTVDHVKGVVRLVEVQVSEEELMQKFEEMKKLQQKQNELLQTLQPIHGHDDEHDHDHDHDHDHEDGHEHEHH